jgi:hypothetical protein
VRVACEAWLGADAFLAVGEKILNELVADAARMYPIGFLRRDAYAERRRG